ncbi:transglutaminase-like domain-containing protein [Polyangium mundeleinium]|uniref:Transglutaminase family protein n=1 Tax=Polyangium mundeleinium TaxID=2995306 RepID=A0ABT5ESZ7_9BACT|nr:transglutaminase family protein [Polyangium mundeleinium]MDC0744946.1 transglutaminase family protein [Polyangium mundeleinium]
MANDALAATDVIDARHPEIAALAAALARGASGPIEIARRCFTWVRDEVRHTLDIQAGPLTCTASEVLRHRTGFCYAKSHLLAALLRANGLPAGLCYQRLANGSGYCLHGFNAVELPGIGWYRIDARGNKPGIDAAFDPPTERLAYAATEAGEVDDKAVYAHPLPVVVAKLRAHTDWQSFAADLPDDVLARV